MLLVTSVSFSAWAQQDNGQTPDFYDRIWGAAQLYDNPDNSVVQSFSLIGRYHGQYWSTARPRKGLMPLSVVCASTS